MLSALQIPDKSVCGQLCAAPPRSDSVCHQAYAAFRKRDLLSLCRFAVPAIAQIKSISATTALPLADSSDSHRVTSTCF
jgi:hypothetical protein